MKNIIKSMTIAFAISLFSLSSFAEESPKRRKNDVNIRIGGTASAGRFEVTDDGISDGPSHDLKGSLQVGLGSNMYFSENRNFYLGLVFKSELSFGDTVGTFDGYSLDASLRLGYSFHPKAETNFNLYAIGGLTALNAGLTGDFLLGVEYGLGLMYTNDLSPVGAFLEITVPTYFGSTNATSGGSEIIFAPQVSVGLLLKC